jgi:hypothetical protein
MSASNDDENQDQPDNLVFDSSETVSFEDEEGNEHTCVVLAITEYGGDEYAMLAPVEQVESSDQEELELYLFRYDVSEDDTEEFSFIEDEAVFAAVQEIFSGMFGEDEAN